VVRQPLHSGWRPVAAAARPLLFVNEAIERYAGRPAAQLIGCDEYAYLAPGEAAAVRAGDLLCLSALYAADADGALPDVSASAGLRYLGVPAQRQMKVILGAAGDICQAGGTSLANVVRAHHFVGDLNSVYPALRIWQEKLAGAPIPFGAVRTSSPMPIPGCDITMDMWAYRTTI